MRILLSGASGLIGSHLGPFLTKRGHEVVRLVRGSAKSSADSISWDPARGQISLSPEEPIDVIINLAGENLGAKRWSRERKQEFLQSRVRSTSLLAETAARMKNPPHLFVNASGINFYGDRGDTLVTEDNRVGSGFLAEICTAWEDATASAQRAGVRTVKARFGMVLSRDGGALPKMIWPFRFGVGGKFGRGQQYMSWIALPDLLEAIQHILYSEQLSGPVNVVSPNPVTNAEFTRILARALHRPALFSVPAWGLRALVGAEMATELLLASTRVEPAKLIASGFEFSCPTLDIALDTVL